MDALMDRWKDGWIRADGASQFRFTMLFHTMSSLPGFSAQSGSTTTNPETLPQMVGIGMMRPLAASAAFVGLLSVGMPVFPNLKLVSPRSNQTPHA